jgi:hypothetical protein
MSDEWASIRRQLGPEFSYGPGHWFCLRHEDVRREDGYPFSRKSGGSGRRVVLATRYGPNATLFARSASTPSSFAHPAHEHTKDSNSCMLDEYGWIDLRIRVLVPADSLCDGTYSCEEPEGSSLLVALGRAVRL